MVGSRTVREGTRLPSDRKLFLQKILEVRLSENNTAQWVKLPAGVCKCGSETLAHFVPRLFTSRAKRLRFLNCATAQGELQILQGAHSPLRQMEALDPDAVKRGIRG